MKEYKKEKKQAFKKQESNTNYKKESNPKEQDQYQKYKTIK